MTDWEKRAGELGLPSWVRAGPERGSHIPDAVELALQLGREMAAARAEEIAKACDERRANAESIHGTVSIAEIKGLETAARFARSFIEKSRTSTGDVEGRDGASRCPQGPASTEAAPVDLQRFLDATREAADTIRPLDLDGIREAAIRADEREKIAAKLRDDGGGATWIERMTGVAKPKTREQVLEEALRDQVAQYGKRGASAADDMWRAAKRALEWKG